MGVVKFIKNKVFKSKTKNKVDNLPDDISECHQVNLDKAQDQPKSLVSSSTMLNCDISTIKSSTIKTLDDGNASIISNISSISSKSSLNIESSNTNESQPKYDLIGITEDIRCQSFVEDYLSKGEISTSESKSSVSDWSDFESLIDPPLDFVCDTEKWVDNRIYLEKELELQNSSIFDLKDLMVDDCDQKTKIKMGGGDKKKELKTKTIECIPEYKYSVEMFRCHKNSITVRKLQLDV